MILSTYLKFNGKIDRRSPANEGKTEDPLVRENWLARDGRLTTVPGTELAITTAFTANPVWEGRYYSIETGITSPKTFVYTRDGKIWLLDDDLKTAEIVKSGLNHDTFPKHVLIKTQTQTKMYLVDGKDLYKYDGNNANKWEKVTITDTNGNSINPVDLIEHRDRLILVSNTFVYVSKNLDFDIFDDATDSIALIVGSGKGQNLALGKLENNLFFFNTEGIFGLFGDVISAVASTFEIRLADERRIIAGRTAVLVEKAIVFLAEDLEVWSWDGSLARMLSYQEKLKDSINPNRNMLDMAVADYHNNYYMLSFVETGHGINNLEIFWDAFEDKIDFVRGRNVSCYMHTDSTLEQSYQQLGRSDTGKIVYADRTTQFDGVDINIKLLTRDITIASGRNARIVAFRPKIEPTWNVPIGIRYHLDGRLSSPTGSNPVWSQNLRGEFKTLGFINIKNQRQFGDRIRPQIAYSRGESIAFEINDSTANLKVVLQGIGIDFIAKGRKKGKIIGE